MNSPTLQPRFRHLRGVVEDMVVSLVLVFGELYKPLRGWRADYSQTRSREQSNDSARVPEP